MRKPTVIFPDVIATGEEYHDERALRERFFPKRYNYYGRFLKEQFGTKVFKVIVDAGFTCPNRDGSKGYGGCAYCNVDSFTPESNRHGGDIRRQVAEGMERAKRNYGARKFIVYFQPNTNTYADADTLERLFTEAVESGEGDVVGLTIGTRPDCIDRKKLEMLKRRFGSMYVSLEYGMESVNDVTLRNINRGHDHACFVEAVRLTASYGFDICAHTIFGLPGDVEADWMRVAEELNRLPIRHVKLHHLSVVEGSILAARYRKRPFELFSLETYADFLGRFLPRLNPQIVVQRLFSMCDAKYLVAPDWGLKKSLIQRRLERGFEERNILQGTEFSD